MSNEQRTPSPYAAEVEFSKKWCDEQPVLFTEKVLSFLEQHPAPYWTYSLTATDGFFTVGAVITKVAA